MAATKVNLTEQVQGTLPVANGGTGGTSQSSAQTALGLGTAATMAGPSGAIVGTTDTQTETNKRITPRIGTATSSATPSINTDNFDQFNITALATAITSMTSGLSGTPTDGEKKLIRIKDAGTAETITWGSSFVSSGVATLLATTVASKTHLSGFIYDSAAGKWVCVAVDAAGY